MPKLILDDFCFPTKARSVIFCYLGFSAYSTSLPSSSKKMLIEHCAQTCTLLPRHVSCPRGLWGTQDFWDLLRAPKAKLTDMRCKPSFARLNTAMKGTYPVLLASKHSAGCQRVYEKEILSNTPPLTLTWVYYSYMPTHPNLKLMLFQSRPAQK